MDCFLEFLAECCCEGGGTCCMEGGCAGCSDAVPSSHRKILLASSIMMSILTVGGLIIAILGIVFTARHLHGNTGVILLVTGIVLLLFGGLYFLLTGLGQRKKRKVRDACVRESAQNNLKQNQYRKGIMGQSTVQPTSQRSEKGDTTKDTDGKEE